MSFVNFHTGLKFEQQQQNLETSHGLNPDSGTGVHTVEVMDFEVSTTNESHQEVVTHTLSHVGRRLLPEGEKTKSIHFGKICISLPKQHFLKCCFDPLLQIISRPDQLF